MFKKTLPVLLFVLLLPTVVLAQGGKLRFTNTQPKILATLQAAGISGGWQLSPDGARLGDLVLDGPLAASYPSIGEQRATVLLDQGRDVYRFTGRQQCAALVDVRFSARRQPLQVLETQIRAHRQTKDGWVTRAVSTVPWLTSREQLPVEGGARYRIEVLFSRGADQQGTAATSTRTFELDLACDQLATLDVDLATVGPVAGTPDLFETLNAVLPTRPAGHTLLDVVAAENVLAPPKSPAAPATEPAWAGETSAAPETFCYTEDFSIGLGSLGATNVGDADQTSATVSGGRLRLTSDGSVLYHAADNGGFVHRSVTGDFRAEVQLLGFPVNAGGGYRKTGIYVSEGTAPNDMRVFAEFLPLHPFYNKTAIMFDYRDANGVERELASTPLDIPLPAWLAIDRRGDTFTVWYSTDGSNWIKPLGAAGGSVTLPMPATVQAGMMQASYSLTTTMTAEFDNFEVCQPNPEILPPPPPSAICAPGRPLDIVYLLDSTGSMTVPFAGGGVTKLDAARDAIAAMNDLIEAQLPGSRAALITFQGGNTPTYNLNQAVRVLANLTTDFDSVDAAADSIDVATINPNSTTPIAIALDRSRQILLDQGNFQSLPVVVFFGDGWANIDYAGNGPLTYRFPEMQAISILGGGGAAYRSIGSVAWLGNWNGSIATWDGEPLANSMTQMLQLKAEVPDLVFYSVAVHSDATYRPDLLGFFADYGQGRMVDVTDATSLVANMVGIFDGLDCGGSIGDRVWNDVDGNGVQDGGEAGLLGVTLELVNAANQVIRTATTDASGNYLFEHVPAGNYTVRILTASLPAGYTATYDFDGVATLGTAALSLADDEAQLLIDFGYKATPLPPVKIAGARWRSFANTGGGEVYLGVGDIGVGANRVERNYTWVRPGTYPVVFTYDPANLKLTSTGAYGTLTYNLNAPLQPMDSFEILISDRDTNSQVDFLDVTLEGQPLGSFFGNGGVLVVKLPSADLNDGFTFTGTVSISGNFSISQELSRVDIFVGQNFYP